MIDTSRLIQTFLDLVQIDSLTFNEGGVAEYVAERLKNLGIEVEIDSAGQKVGSNTGNVIAFLPGSNAPTILFIAHMDTVSPGENIKPRIENNLIKSNGQTILGADDKAGIAIILELFQTVLENNLSHGGIEAVFTIAEEKGLLGSKNLELSRLRGRYAYVLDGDGPVGGIVIKAPSQNSIKATFYGKAAHAGLEPEKGINAIQAVSLAISRMKLGRIDGETTSNIGVIKGGLASNIVPAEAEIEGEARSHSEQKLNSQTKLMCDCIKEASKTVGTRVEIDLSRAYDAFTLSEQDEVVKLAVEAARKIGMAPKLIASGGGSDTNIFNKAGIPAVNLSVGYTNVHSTNEQIAVKDLELAARLAVEIVSCPEVLRGN